MFFAGNSYGEETGKIIKISAGYDFTVTLKDDGTVIAWEENTHGQGNCQTKGDMNTDYAVGISGKNLGDFNNVYS